ncbi:stage II sporulation protein M [Mobilitalea sibirica]|uniref:Stage II sporulation protein M n=1 Tax=Mobilitalea sibirica TaxID=1462919 RepID=A0A8J7H3H6_9FIRM|nr:stage II sporulation protein M [Mobilitalea sibirica]MBH1941475.1 stage II sporulation protein M [Mobilitalea sibirica]
MKQLKLQLHRLSALQLAIILLILGLFIGIFFANVFRNSYQEQINEYQNTVFQSVTTKDINYSGLFTYVLGKNFKEFAYFWMFSITILGIPYMAYKIFSFGFSAGFFISAVAMNYGFKGILLILVYIFPHGLIYLPIAMFSLYKGYTLCQTVYFDNRNYLGSIFKLVKPYLLIILLLAIILLAGSFLEAYIGAFILKKTLGLFV